MFPVLSGIYRLGSARTEVIPTVQRLLDGTVQVECNWIIERQISPLEEGKGAIPVCVGCRVLCRRG